MGRHLAHAVCYHSCYRFNPQSGNDACFTAFHHRRESLDQLQLTPLPALGPPPFRSKEMEYHLQKQEE